VSASVNLPLHHKVQKFSSGTGLPGWSRKKDRKMVVLCGGYAWLFVFCWPRFIVVYFCDYFSWFLTSVFSVLAKRLAGKSISTMTYFVSSGM